MSGVAMQNVIDFSALPVTFSSESESPVGVFGYGHPDGNAICRAPNMAHWLNHTVRPAYPGEIPPNTPCVLHQSDAARPALRQEKDVLLSMILRFASTKG